MGCGSPLQTPGAARSGPRAARCRGSPLLTHLHYTAAGTVAVHLQSGKVRSGGWQRSIASRRAVGSVVQPSFYEHVQPAPHPPALGRVWHLGPPPAHTRGTGQCTAALHCKRTGARRRTLSDLSTLQSGSSRAHPSHARRRHALPRRTAHRPPCGGARSFCFSERVVGCSRPQLGCAGLHNRACRP